MRWLPCLILAYIAIGLQAGLSTELRIYGVPPNLGLLIAVFIALNAPREPALLCCVVVGGMQDLATQQAPGLYALSYGLVGAFVASLQSVVSHEHPVTHAVLSLIGGCITAGVIWVHGLLVPAATSITTPSGVHLPAMRIGLGTLVASALYTALLAPIVIGVLQRFRPLFGFQSLRRNRGGGGRMSRRAPY
jgi:rod shape-determining protein MreD